MAAKVTCVGLAIVIGAAVTGCADKPRTAATVGLDRSTCSAVEYGGAGKAHALIVSDLPMRGGSAERSKQQVAAIRLALQKRSFRAGDINVGFQVCDDSVPSTALWDRETCRANAEAYAKDTSVLGVIGTYNSGCAAIEIPILNRASVAMISPGNTAVCLTQASPLCTDYTPRSLYPTGKRNYARVVPNDAHQGAALAEYVFSRRVRRPFVLYAANDPTSTGQAVNFRGAARQIGLRLSGYETWNPDAENYEALMRRVKTSGADGVVLAGLIEQNGGRLIRDKVAVLGDNSAVKLFAFDGFALQATIEEAGAAARGMFASIPGQSPGQLSSEGRAFADELARLVGTTSLEVFAPYAGEAADVLLDAIASAGTDRAKIVNAVFATDRKNGIIGSYRFTNTGDPTAGPVTILRASDTFMSLTLVTAKPATVDAARTGS